MRIAVIGSGISGLTAAHLLHEGNDLVLYERNPTLGGHTRTLDVSWEGEPYAVDTGFIVFNRRNYPNFTRLLERLGAASKPSDMSFGVRCEKTGLEYRATSLDTLFAQRRNLLNPRFLRMLLEVIRFRRDTARWLEAPPELTLGEVLQKGRYSSLFVERFILPMGAAIWSASPEGFRRVPASFFSRFFTNHGFLNLRDQPRWRVVRGGSRSYVEVLTRPFREKIRTGTPVERVRRLGDAVEVTARGERPKRFDAAVIAAHSDEALAMLADPTEREREILGAIPYGENEAVLHTDDAILPRREKARASWNVHILPERRGRVAVTYDMSRLQGLDAPVTFCVTLNRTEAVDPARIIDRTVFSHPVYTPEALRAQRRRREISGVNRTWYCGAYWGYGFHEDGAASALEAAKDFGRSL